MIATEDYRVRLSSFEGPLDLLLFLIRRHEVDLSAISLAQITDQYLAFLAQLDRVDIEDSGEFLVTAATLLELKSRLIAPGLPQGEAEAADSSAALDRETDAGAELVRSLLQYALFRRATEALDRRRAEWHQRWPAAPARVDESALRAESDEPPPLDLEDIGLFDLASAYQRIIETVQLERVGPHRVTDDDTPIEVWANDILDRLRRFEADCAAHEGESDTARQFRLRTLFEGRPRQEVIGLFLATLELVRQRLVRVAQAEPGAEILVQRIHEGEDDRTPFFDGDNAEAGIEGAGPPASAGT